MEHLQFLRAMNTMFKHLTIRQIIKGFEQLPEDTELTRCYHLKKLLVSFEIENVEVKQVYCVQQWNSDEFNNLEIDTLSSYCSCTPDSRCPESMYQSGGILTVGELIKSLREFDLAYENKLFTITSDLKLVDEPVVRLEPIVCRNEIPWRKTQLVDNLLARNKFTNALQHVFDGNIKCNIDVEFVTHKAILIQKLIDSSGLQRFNIYLINTVDGYKLTDDLAEAQRQVFVRFRKLKFLSSVIDLPFHISQGFKQILESTPNVYVLDEHLVQEAITTSCKLITLLGKLNVDAPPSEEVAYPDNVGRDPRQLVAE